MSTCNTNTSSSAQFVQDWLSTAIGKEQNAGAGTTWNEYAFWIAVVIAFGLIGYVLYTTGRVIAMALVFIAMIFMTLYYWIKWFRATGGSQLGIAGVWPPLISPCPDYMIETTPGSKQCYDPTGLFYPACGSSGQPMFSRTTPLDMRGITATSIGDFCTKVSALTTVPLTWDGIKDGAYCMY